MKQREAFEAYWNKPKQYKSKEAMAWDSWKAAQEQAADLRGVSDAQGLTTVPAHTTGESSGHPTTQTPDCGCIGPRECTGECCKQAAVEPVCWGIYRPDGIVWDVISNEEHTRHVGDYTVPLYRTPPDHTKTMRLALEELKFYRSCYGGSGSSLTAIAALEESLK